MKLTQLVLGIILLTFPNLTTAQTTYLLDSTYLYLWNFDIEDWDLSVTKHYGYDYNQAIVAQKEVEYNPNTGEVGWFENQQIVKNEEGRIIRENYFALDGVTLVRYVDYVYEAKGDSIELRKIWYNMNGEAQDFIFEVLDTNYQVKMQEMYLGTTQPFERLYFTYDENGNLIQKDFHPYQWQDSTFSYWGKDEFIYDEDNNMIQASRAQWDENTGLFTTLSYVNMIYFNNQIQQRVSYRWDNNNWYEYYRDEYTYENGLLQTIKYFQWYALFGYPIEIAKEEYIYDENDNISELLVFRYTGSEYLNYSKTDYYYHSFDESDINGTNYQIPTYPNPATDNLTLIIPEALQNGQGLLFNMQGQLVQQYSLIGRIANLDVSGLSNGVYLLKIMNGEEHSTVRIIKQ